MHFLYFSSSTLPLTLFCLFFIMQSGFLVSQSGPQVFEQEEYQNCHDAAFKCGNISIGYPFFGGDRVKECGHPELKLLCDHPTNTTTIDILDVNYRVLSIQHDRQILKIWKRDEWTTNDGLCRLPFQDDPDSILDFQVLTPGPNFTNVTLFLDCPSSPTNISSGLRVFPCYYDDYTSSSVTVAIANNTHPEGCSDNLTVSILRTSWEGVRNRSLELEQAFPTGFEVRWKEDKEACLNCNASGGACGFGKENQTVCYCPLGSSPDYPNFNKCNHPQPQSLSQSPTGSKSRSKQHLVLIGMPVAAIVLVSAICYVFLRFKRKSLSNHLCPKKMNGHAKIEAFITKFGSIAPRRYPYAGIKKMTNKFNEKLGQGGYGCVYKGKLPDGRLVAVKLLSESKVCRIDKEKLLIHSI